MTKWFTPVKKMNLWSKIKLAACNITSEQVTITDYLEKILILCTLTHTFLCHYCTFPFGNTSWTPGSSDPTSLSGSSCLCGVHFLQWNYFNLECFFPISLRSKTQMLFNSYNMQSKEANWELKCSCPLPKSSAATPLFQHVPTAWSSPEQNCKDHQLSIHVLCAKALTPNSNSAVPLCIQQCCNPLAVFCDYRVWM